MPAISDMLVAQRPEATSAWARYDYDEKLASRFRLTDRFDNPYLLYKSQNGKLFLPRAFCPIGEQDLRVRGYDVDFDLMHPPRNDEQDRVIVETYDFLQAGQSGIVQCPTGFGKCLAWFTPVLMYDGRIKNVQDIAEGELVMGPDGGPRRVVGTVTGESELFKVTPTKGEPYVVNDAHILSLRITGGSKLCRTRDQTSEIVNIPVKEYLAKSKTFKHCAKGWRVGVPFTPKVSLPLDPYFVGLWLGDGTSSAPAVTTVDEEIIAYLDGLAETHGAVHNRHGITSYLSGRNQACRNYVRDVLENLGLMGDKHVPHAYRTASREDRLQLLAGLVDSDGHLAVKGSYEFVFKSEKIVEGLLFVARSLGLAAYAKPCRKKCHNTGAEGDYHRVIVSGDIEQIPVKVSRKKATPRRQKKNVLNVGIEVESAGWGKYAGFELEGPDRLFLLGDFTVTHNTYCAYAVTALMRVPTLVVCTKDDLFDQWIEGAHQFLGLPYSKIGRIRQNCCDVAGKPFVVGMIHSLAIEGKYPDWIKKAFGLVHFDEVQRLPAAEFSKVAGMFGSMWRVGWSATPDRADGREIVFFGHIGPVRVVSDATPMTPEVFRYRTNFQLPMRRQQQENGTWKLVKMPHQPGRIGHVLNILAKDDERNRLIAKLGSMCYKNGRNTVLFSDHREHLEILHEHLLSLGVRSNDIAYYVGGLKKHEKEAAKKKRFLLATYNFMGEGSDIPTLDAAILSTPRSDVRQIVGRVIRSLDGKKTPVVIDLIDDDSHVFRAYADKRLRFYTGVGATVSNVV